MKVHQSQIQKFKPRPVLLVVPTGTITLSRPGLFHILTRHSNTSGISRISFRVVRNMMPPLECSFRTIFSIAKLPCGRFCSVCHALQVGLALIGNDLAAFSENNPTGTSSNTDRVSRHTLTFCPDRYYFPLYNTGRDYFCLFFQTSF